MSELPRLPLNKATRFRNTTKGYEESIPWLGWLWCLLFGPVYFAVKGVKSATLEKRANYSHLNASVKVSSADECHFCRERTSFR